MPHFQHNLLADGGRSVARASDSFFYCYHLLRRGFNIARFGFGFIECSFSVFFFILVSVRNVAFFLYLLDVFGCFM